MPILPMEQAIFPEQLLDPDFCAKNQGDWWVLHTKPRTEKTLARKLLTNSIPFFLPVYSKRSRHGNRTLTSHLPLFPSYLFLNGDDSARREALETNCVVRTIQVVERDRLIADLSRIYRLMVSGIPMAPEDRLQPGQWVQITSGPLQGMEGKLIRRGARDQLIVEVNFLQRGAAVEVEGWAIKPMDTEPYRSTTQVAV
jgi:transcription antitermination factor NusG